jgi:hypothetical protein
VLRVYFAVPRHRRSAGKSFDASGKSIAHDAQELPAPLARCTPRNQLRTMRTLHTLHAAEPFWRVQEDLRPGERKHGMQEVVSSNLIGSIDRN